MTKTEKSATVKKLAQDSILQYLDTQDGVSRQSILEGAGLVLTELCKAGQIKTERNQAKSVIGSVLNDMLRENRLKQDKNDKIFLGDDAIAVSRAECEHLLLSLLKTHPYKKADLFADLISELGADQTTSQKDDQQIKTFVGQILSELTKADRLAEKDHLLVLREKSETSYKKIPLPEETFKPLFMKRLHEKGGLFFEKYLANMLERYFTVTGRDVLACEIVGGSDDGGIDIMIKVSEELGFVENIVIQAKCRKSIHVTETEIRGFYGAMHVANGSRGIFVTTSTFHPAAKKLLESLDNCIGIDGEKLFELAKITQYGLHETKSGFTFDDLVFNL